MKPKYKRFNSWDDVKSSGEFFKKGQIVPRRILACDNKKEQHLWKFGCNCIALPTPKGYLLAAFCGDDYVAILVNQKTAGNQCYSARGSIYTDEGCTHWYGNYKMDIIEFLHGFNDRYIEACS